MARRAAGAGVSGLLEDRVAAWVADHPGRRAVEISRAVAGRHQTVLRILETPIFAAEPAGRGAVVYRLAAGAGDWRERSVGGGRLARQRFTQGAAILAVLAGGTWHTTAEIHRRAGFSRLNSRISELRKRGFVIECRHVEERGLVGARAYEYRLVSAPSSDA